MDEDLILDTVDLCPNEKERYNGYQDEDGCPDFPPYDSIIDTDRDAIPDHLDQCPNVKETYNKFQDLDGCPDNVADNKGIPDTDGDVFIWTQIHCI